MFTVTKSFRSSFRLQHEQQAPTTATAVARHNACPAIALKQHLYFVHTIFTIAFAPHQHRVKRATENQVSQDHKTLALVSNNKKIDIFSHVACARNVPSDAHAPASPPLPAHANTNVHVSATTRPNAPQSNAAPATRLCWGEHNKLQQVLSTSLTPFLLH